MSPALWYLTRGTGAVTLALLTASVVLGVLDLERTGPGPRFVVAALHRSVSLLVVVLLGVHVATAVLDTFAPIRLVDAVVPFVGTYRPLWLGLGALALDLLVALIVTSVLRRRLGLRAWRAVHWLAYACWPVAVLHGLGTGSDAKTAWMQALTALCAAAVGGAVAVRIARAGPGRGGARIGAALATAAAFAATLAWLPGGPLGHGWARRAGTPARLLAVAPVAARTPVADPLARGFAGRVSGTLREGSSPGGTEVVDLHLRAGGEPIRVRLGGLGAPGGGLDQLLESSVAVGTGAHAYRGRVSLLSGNRVGADIGAADGHALRLRLDLVLEDTAVGGTAVARPIGATR